MVISLNNITATCVFEYGITMDAYLMTNEAFLNRTWLVFFSIHRVFYKLQYVNAIALLVLFC